ncbi:MAG: GDP-mannose 4,6-dehydratase, partial [Nanoarchaeota archaeon]
MDDKEIKRVLITGITGSGGSYLAEYIVDNHPEVEVHGISRWHSTTTQKNTENIKDKIKIHECDLNDFSSVCRILMKANPDAIFHLASHANVRAAWDTPLGVMQNNIMGTANLLEAVHFLKL